MLSLYDFYGKSRDRSFERMAAKDGKAKDFTLENKKS